MTPGARRGQSALGVCTAPTYPEWAATEEGDRVWVRLDLADRAEEVASVALDCDLPRAKLALAGVEFMWLDRIDTEWSEDWLLRRVVADSDEAVAYAHYEVVEDERKVCEGCEERIDGEVVWFDMDAFCATCADDLLHPEIGDYGQIMPGTTEARPSE